jgi:hypothetical protein
VRSAPNRGLKLAGHIKLQHICAHFMREAQLLECWCPQMPASNISELCMDVHLFSRGPKLAQAQRIALGDRSSCIMNC